MPIPSPYEQQYDEYGRPVQKLNYAPITGPPPAIVAAGQPDYSPIHITPVAPMPAEAHMAAIAPPDPRDPQFKQSRLRTVLNAIAGGFAGASGGPKAGYEIGQSLHDSKFNTANQHYKDQLELLQSQTGVEKERRRVGEEEVKAGVSRGSAQSLDVKRRADVENAENKTRIAEEEHQRKIEDDKRKARLADQNIKVKDWAMKNPNNPYQIIGNIDPSDTEAIAEAMKTIKEIREAAVKPPETPEHARKMSQARAEGTIAGGGTPASLAATAAKTETTVAAQERAHTSTEAIAGQSALARAKSMSTATSTMKDTAAFAREALPHVDNTLASIPKLAAKLGPAYGRWNDFMAGKIGQGDPDFMRLRDAVLLLNTNLGRVHGGARGGGSKFMLEHFKSMADAGKMDEKTLTASMQEFKTWLQGYANMSNMDLSKPLPPEELAAPPWEKGGSASKSKFNVRVNQ